jgi:hypothetical protein
VPQPPIDPGRIIQLIQTRRDIKLAGENRLRWTTASPAEARAANVITLLQPAEITHHMNLIVQGHDIPTQSLKQLAKLSGAAAIERFRRRRSGCGGRRRPARRAPRSARPMRSTAAGCRPTAASATSASW